MVWPLWTSFGLNGNVPLRNHEPVLCAALCTAHCSCNFHVLPISASDDNKIWCQFLDRVCIQLVLYHLSSMKVVENLVVYSSFFYLLVRETCAYCENAEIVDMIRLKVGHIFQIWILEGTTWFWCIIFKTNRIVMTNRKYYNIL